MARRLAGASINGPCSMISLTCMKCRRRLYMFTIAHAQKYTSRPTSLADSSVILTRASGPGGIARFQPGDGVMGGSAAIDPVRAVTAIRQTRSAVLVVFIVIFRCPQH